MVAGFERLHRFAWRDVCRLSSKLVTLWLAGDAEHAKSSVVAFFKQNRRPVFAGSSKHDGDVHKSLQCFVPVRLIVETRGLPDHVVAGFDWVCL